MHSRDLLRKYVPARWKQNLKRRLTTFSEHLRARASAGYGYKDWLLTPGEFRRAVCEYDSTASVTARELIARRQLDRISINPGYARLLPSTYFASEFGTHPLFLQACAAESFRNGDFAAAAERLRAAVAQDPSRLNHLLLATCLKWAGAECEAIVGVLDQGLAHNPGDLSLNLFAATNLFLHQRTAAANERIKPIRGALKAAVEERHPFLRDMEVELHEAEASGLQRRAKGFHKDAYSEENIRDTYWEDYWCEMTALRPTQFGRAYTSSVVQDRVTQALASLNPAPDTVINFGCLCADADHQLARRFAQVRFVGVDRETATAGLNRQAYQTANLTFVASDILEALPQVVAASKGPVLLLHARTVNLTLPVWVRHFYSRCYDLGVTYILGYENASMSKTHLGYYDFGSLPGNSVVFQNGQFLHDYDRYLSDAGYAIEQMRRSQEIVLHSAHDGLHLADSHITFLARRD